MVITGSTDGVVRMWSMEYVQVPVAAEKPKSLKDEETEEKIEDKLPAEVGAPVTVDLVKQLSVTHEEIGK